MVELDTHEGKGVMAPLLSEFKVGGWHNESNIFQNDDVWKLQ